MSGDVRSRGVVCEDVRTANTAHTGETPALLGQEHASGAICFTLPARHHFEDVAFEVFGFGDAQDDGVVGALTVGF